VIRSLFGKQVLVFWPVGILGGFATLNVDFVDEIVFIFTELLEFFFLFFQGIAIIGLPAGGYSDVQRYFECFRCVERFVSHELFLLLI
jgi:hypothetical protein